jgi:hypothetical protein
MELCGLYLEEWFNVTSLCCVAVLASSGKSLLLEYWDPILLTFSMKAIKVALCVTLPFG